ncbi:MAG: VPLPA-CTERM sorting domain-containing protein [Gammaproteobacteria bacterium]
MKKVLAAVALIGAVGVAQAAPATLTGVTSYSKNGTAIWNISLGTGNAQWDVDTGTGTATQLGGTLKMNTKVGPNILSTIAMSGGVLGSGAPSATSWSCTEGTFGYNVGAHICGNLLLGGNTTLDSIIGNSGTATTVILAGDDIPIGAPQTLANSFNNMTLSSLGGGNWKLSNGVVGVGGYDFTFNVVPVPAAVWLFGSALGLMGAMRRRTAA